MVSTRSVPWPTNFVGRTDELRHLHDLMARGRRWISIVGPPGVGKTRLAFQFAEASPRQVVVCNAGEAQSAHELLHQLASTLGLALGSSVEVTEKTERIANALLQLGEVLVVMDEVERVVDSVADSIATIVSMVPNLGLVSTSRRRAKHVVESVLELAPLRPDEGLALLRDRVRSVRGNLVDEFDDEKSFADVVLRLEGLPLALELAAARMHALSAGKLMTLLGAEPQGVSATALRGCLDASWDALPEDARDLASSISLFRATFSLGAAHSVHATSQGDENVTARALEHLRDHSLINAAIIDDEMRYSLYTYVRAYARQRLSESERHSRKCALYARWVVQHAEKAAARLNGADSIRARMDLVRLRPDLQALAAGECDEFAVRALLVADRVSEVLGELGAHRDLAQAVVANAAFAQLPEGLQSLVWSARARTAVDLKEAAASAQSSITLAERSGDPRVRAEAYRRATDAALNQGRYRESQRHAKMALASAVVGGHCWLDSLRMFAYNEAHLGNVAGARVELSRGIAAAMQSEDRVSEARLRTNLATLAHQEGQLEDAFANATTAAEIYRENALPQHEARVLSNLAAWQVEHAYAEAATTISRFRELSGRSGDVQLVAFVNALEGLIHLDRGEPGVAQSHLEKAIADLRRIGAGLAPQLAPFLAQALMLQGRTSASVVLMRDIVTELGGQGAKDLTTFAECQLLMAEAVGANHDRADALQERLGREPLDVETTVLRDLGVFYRDLVDGRSDASPQDMHSRFVHLFESEQSRKCLERSVRHRAAHRLCRDELTRALFRPDLPPTLCGARPDALTVSEDGSLLRSPWGATQRVDGAAPRKMLIALARASMNSPPSALSRDELLHVGWGDEKLSTKSATNRLNVALSALRKAGLGTLLRRRQASYSLDERVSVTVCGADLDSRNDDLIRT